MNKQTPDPKNLICQDAEVYLGNSQNGTKMQHPLRLIKTEDKEGNPVIIVTSCFDLTAKEIGDLYRYRWEIEIFLKDLIPLFDLFSKYLLDHLKDEKNTTGKGICFDCATI